MLPLIGLLIGIAVGLLLEPTLPLALQPYLPIAIVAAMDALFGAFRAYLEGIFSDRVFVTSFISNVLIAAMIVWVGDQIGVGLPAVHRRGGGARHPHLHQRRRDPPGPLPCLSRSRSRGAPPSPSRRPIRSHRRRRRASRRR